MTTLNELCAAIVDCEHKTAPIQDEGYPSIRTPNIGRGFFLLEGVNRVSEETYAAWTRREVPKSGDLILAREAPVGNVAVIPEGESFCLGQRTVLIRPDKSRINPDYLCYLLLTPEMQGRMRGKSGGATVNHLNLKDIRAMKMPELPVLREQVQRASVLKNYDDLIAINQRRIALLEDAARRLYREWFVHLRFPGHESVPVKDGVPEGWRISTFGEQVSIRKGKNLTRSSVIPGEIPVVAAGLEPMCYHNAANTKGPVITISASGANAGYVKLYHEDIWASDCSYISNDVTDDLYFFYCALKERQTEILLMQKGAAQPHVYPKDIQAMDMIWPCHEVVALFQEYVASMFAFCGALLKQSDQLAQARDLLLPKLMSGQLDVSGIALPDEVAV